MARSSVSVPRAIVIRNGSPSKNSSNKTPKEKTLYLICDNYATHKHPKVLAWLDRHPRIHVCFTPTSAS